MAPRKDYDKADEGTLPFDPATDPQTPKGAQTFRENTRVKPEAAKATPSRTAGAYQLGGVWYAADGSTLAPPEIQKAHRAMDAAAAEARRKALLGGGE